MVAVAIDHERGSSSTNPPISSEHDFEDDPQIVGALRAVGEAIVAEVLRSFTEQRDPWGAAWAPLHEATKELRLARLGVRARRAAIKAGSAAFTILVDKAALRNGIHSAVEKLSAVVGVGGAAAKYAKAQQFGNPLNRMFGKYAAPLIARAFFPLRNGEVDLPEALRREIVSTFLAALDAMLRRRGVL